MSISKRCTPYLWHSLVAISVCMLILSPASGNQHPPQPVWGEGGEWTPCEGDWDCDGIADDKDFCPQARDHALAYRAGTCDSKINSHQDVRFGLEAYLTCDQCAEDRDKARSMSYGTAILGVGFCWIVWLGASFGAGAIAFSLLADRAQEMYDNAKCGHEVRF